MPIEKLGKYYTQGVVKYEPELRFTPTGKAICNFTILDGDGNLIRIVTWEDVAEYCNQFLQVGNRVLVDGQLQVRSWETQEGETKSVREVVGYKVVKVREVPNDD